MPSTRCTAGRKGIDATVFNFIAPVVWAQPVRPGRVVYRYPRIQDKVPSGCFARPLAPNELPLPEPVAQPLDPAVYGLSLRRHAEAVATGFVNVQLGRPPGISPSRVEADAAGLGDGVVGG